MEGFYIKSIWQIIISKNIIANLDNYIIFNVNLSQLSR